MTINIALQTWLRNGSEKIYLEMRTFLNFFRKRQDP